MIVPPKIVSIETSRALDLEAQADWGFNVHALIEAAGRLCAQAFAEAFPAFFKPPRSASLKITVAAGTGNNAADAMVMLRCWILPGLAEASSSALLISRMPKNDETAPWADLLHSLKKMNVPVLVWDEDKVALNDTLANSDIIVDGISGTGLSGPLRGTLLDMANAINLCEKKPSPLPTTHSPLPKPLVISVDLPSGISDAWEPGMPIVKADLTLSIEPGKQCLYAPAARPHAGVILPVKGVFPRELIARHGGAELLDWESARGRISKIPPEAYKNARGTVEIRAGSPGATGAALIAARGAQAAGAGLIRLVTDDEIYPILASQSSGIMVAPASAEDGFEGRHRPDAILLGPGWGMAEKRLRVLEKALALEKAGTPLILDADAIELARDKLFNGNAILTPHPMEFSRFTGIDKEELLSRPFPVLLKYSRERNAVILFKGHVIAIAAPDGRLGVLDGMKAVLASGGSGDLLAGFCAAIAARALREGSFDAYACAAASAGLLIASAECFEARFTDPLELADKAADLAGEAWLRG